MKTKVTVDTKDQDVKVSKDRLAELGFAAASENMEARKALHRKLVIAYEHFRFLTPEKIDAFNADIKKRTLKQHRSAGGWIDRETYDQLLFTDISKYPEVPPADVLDKLADAKDLNCFDRFEIAQIKNVEIKKDPLLLGVVQGCADRFFIAQWDDDVKIEDILKENEG